MSDSVAQDQIKAFVDRILRLKEEVKAINADIREIYGEAKGNGFDKTVLGKLVNYVEKRQSDPNALSESEAIFDLYLSAYYGVGTRVATHTHEADEIPEHDADGVIIEPQSAPPQAAQMHGDEERKVSLDVDHLPFLAGAEGIEDRQPIQPETANAIPDEPTNGGPHESAAHPELVNLDRRPGPPASEVGQNGSEHQRAEDTETNEAPAGRVADESPATNITQLREPKPLRPNCLNPGKCGGQGKNHCWTCTKSMNEGMRA